MRADAYSRPGDGQVGILMVHGILGTPEHFAFLMPLAPEGWAVENLLLPGHGGPGRELSRTSMGAWREHVHGALSKLRRENRRVVIAGHSMGTLFAIEEAVAEPVEALFLMNVPLYPTVRPGLLREMWTVYRGKAREDDEWGQAALRAFGLERDLNPLAYLGWVPRYLELFAEMKKVRGMLPELRTPCRAWFSEMDEMVSPRSQALMRQATKARVGLLPGCGHHMYTAEAMERLKADFREMVAEVDSV